MTTDQTPAATDFDGCNRRCRKAGAHTLAWGECEHAPKPEPTVSMSKICTDPEDGYPSIGYDTYTVPELARLIETAAGDPVRAAAVARTIVHRNDPAASVSPPATPADTPSCRAGLRDEIAAAMREHYLCTNPGEADADGNMPCRCGDWREPGAEVDDENDWDSHCADAVLAVLYREWPWLRAEAEDATPAGREQADLRTRAEKADQYADATATAAAHMVNLVRERAERAEARVAELEQQQADTRAADRQQIIEALYEARRPGLGGMTEAEAVAHMADAVLRRLADETLASDAHPPTTMWKVESPRRDQWASWGMTYDDRDWARESYEHAATTAPSRPFRLVSATTTYTVEAEHTPEQPAEEGR